MLQIQALLSRQACRQGGIKDLVLGSLPDNQCNNVLYGGMIHDSKIHVRVL